MSQYLPKLILSVTTVDGFSNINWKDVAAVRALNKALLRQDWGLEVDMKEDRLCPPVCRYAGLRLTIDT
jgi:23S rRNA A1618 N6-methylase RlmF